MQPVRCPKSPESSTKRRIYEITLGIVRLQNRQIEYELKVRQKERVPSRFDTRLWLCGLHGRVQI